MRRAVRSLTVMGCSHDRSLRMGVRGCLGAMLKIVWYPALSIVKCAGHRESTVKSINITVSVGNGCS